MFSIRPSAEQKRIIQAYLSGHNGLVAAVPGAGKTTLVECMIRGNPTANVIILTYNRALADSTNARLKGLHTLLEKMLPAGTVQGHRECYTYHKLLGVLTDAVVSDDVVFDAIMAKIATAVDDPMGFVFSSANLVFVDEGQDMKPLYFSLLEYVLMHVIREPKKCVLWIVGDVYQLLYDFYRSGNADERFLTKAPMLFKAFNSLPWMRTTLNSSYRLHPGAATFINAVCPNRRTAIIGAGQLAATTTRSQGLVEIIVCDVFTDPKTLLADYVRGFKACDITIVCPSVNERSPAVPLVNALVQGKTGLGKLKVNVVRQGDTTNAVYNKPKGAGDTGAITVRTMHSAKGLESECVVVLDLDGIWVENGEVCNALFVGLTRSVAKQVVFTPARKTTRHAIEAFSQRCVRDNSVRITVKREPNKRFPKPRDKQSVPKTMLATNLFSFIDVVDLSKLLAQVEIVTVTDALPGIIERHHLARLKRSGVQTTTQVALSFLDYETMTAKYLQSMRVDNNSINMTSMVGQAMLYCVEHVVTGRIPSDITAALGRVSADTIDIAGYIATALHNVRQPRMHGDDDIAFMHRRIPAFTALALYTSAIRGYVDRVYRVQDFSFVNSAGVFARLTALYNNVHKILRVCTFHEKQVVAAQRGPRAMDMDEGDGEDTGLLRPRFRVVAQSHVSYQPTPSAKVSKVKFVSHAAILVGSSAVVQCIHEPDISKDRMLSVLVDADIHGVPLSFFINLYDGKMMQVHLNEFPTLSPNQRNEKFTEFLGMSMSSKLHKEVKVSDRVFTQRYTIQVDARRAADALRSAPLGREEKGMANSCGWLSPAESAIAMAVFDRRGGVTIAVVDAEEEETEEGDVADFGVCTTSPTHDVIGVNGDEEEKDDDDDEEYDFL